VYKLQVTSQHIRPGGLANTARLQVQQQIQFPFGERMPPDGPADHFLNELTERRQISTYRSGFCQVRKWRFPQKNLQVFCDSAQ
jgi:hypothetical protein